MAKLTRKLKLQLPAGAATPAPPVGTALGPAGVNIGEFVTRFNQATQNKRGSIIPVEISVYEDRSFDFILKTSPASDLLKKAAGVEKGSGKNILAKAGKVTKAQVRAIAEEKMPDLNANDLEQAEKIIAGTARSMGIDVTL
ncbi:MAG: 50S ribosomal protein L11 [Parcubacteria group bacterium]|nr:50S ribosomal protein L11 [Parcubacteria group bacterium]